MIFRNSDPIRKLASELEKYRARESALAEQLAQASEAVQHAARSRQSILLDDDVAAVERASAALETAQARERDACDRHAAVVTRREAIEQELAEARDRVAREEEVATLQKIRADIEARLAGHVQSARGLFEALETVNIGRGLAAQLDACTASLRTEITSQILRILDRRIEDIGAGRVPLPRKAEAAA
jgi:hypothetical protein